MAKVVSEPDVSQVDVYFPGVNEIWYNKYTYQQVRGGGMKSIPVTQNEVSNGRSQHLIRFTMLSSNDLDLHYFVY